MAVPKVFFVGATQPNVTGIQAYLDYTKQSQFMEGYKAAIADGIAPAECMISLFAKLCYSSVVEGKNSNLEKIRGIKDNLRATQQAAHGSVFEHVMLNFIVTDCSRVMTHELVRHRVGTAFSQTSGRFVRLDSIDVVTDPALAGCEYIFEPLVAEMEDAIYLAECRLGLRKAPENGCDPMLWLDNRNPQDRWLPDNTFDFAKRKKITSALRRYAPNGQTNEIAFSVNLTALRHCVLARTSRHAEREIRGVFAQIYAMTKAVYPTLWDGAREEIVDGIIEVSGMRLHPYEIQPGDPEALRHWSTAALAAEMEKRNAGA